jgi:hypothetical protein
MVLWLMLLGHDDAAQERRKRSGKEGVWLGDRVSSCIRLLYPICNKLSPTIVFCVESDA